MDWIEIFVRVLQGSMRMVSMIAIVLMIDKGYNKFARGLAVGMMLVAVGFLVGIVAGIPICECV